jgi:hypothetical protein
MNLIIEQIKRRANLEHGGDFDKAACEYFRDHPQAWQDYTDEVTVVKKRGGEDPERVNAAVQYRIEFIAGRDKLDLGNPADRLTAYSKVFAEDPDLYKRYKAATSVRVGKVSVTD